MPRMCAEMILFVIILYSKQSSIQRHLNSLKNSTQVIMATYSFVLAYFPYEYSNSNHIIIIILVSMEQTYEHMHNVNDYISLKRAERVEYKEILISIPRCAPIFVLRTLNSHRNECGLLIMALHFKAREFSI